MQHGTKEDKSENQAEPGNWNLMFASIGRPPTLTPKAARNPVNLEIQESWSRRIHADVRSAGWGYEENFYRMPFRTPTYRNVRAVRSSNTPSGSVTSTLSLSQLLVLLGVEGTRTVGQRKHISDEALLAPVHAQLQGMASPPRTLYMHRPCSNIQTTFDGVHRQPHGVLATASRPGQG